MPLERNIIPIRRKDPNRIERIIQVLGATHTKSPTANDHDLAFGPIETRKSLYFSPEQKGEESVFLVTPFGELVISALGGVGEKDGSLLLQGKTQGMRMRIEIFPGGSRIVGRIDRIDEISNIERPNQKFRTLKKPITNTMIAQTVGANTRAEEVVLGSEQSAQSMETLNIRPEPGGETYTASVHSPVGDITIDAVQRVGVAGKFIWMQSWIDDTEGRADLIISPDGKHVIFVYDEDLLPPPPPTRRSSSPKPQKEPPHEEVREEG